MKTDYKCTQCGGDAFIGMSNWKDASGKVLIKKDERLCLKCSKTRQVNWSFQTVKTQPN